MSASRKRYRPLDLGEERDVGVTDDMSVGILHNEKSYCFSWPEAPLSLLLNSMYSPNDSSVATAYSSVNLPQLISVQHENKMKNLEEYPKVYRAINEKSNVEICHIKSDLLSGLNSKPLTHKAQDLVFSLSDEQIADARAAGLFSLKPFSNSVLHDVERSIQRKIEEEVLQLEWRAYREGKHTEAALQRLLLLEAAVPFLGAKEGLQREEEQWKYTVYLLWIYWRTNQPNNTTVVQKWGSSLLPEGYLYGNQYDYFLNTANSSHGGHLARQRDGMHQKSQNDQIKINRRRTAYNFLSWKVEYVIPHLRHYQLNSGEYSSSQSTISSDLSKKVIGKALNFVFHEPFSRIELDDAFDETKSLECSDIRKDVESWANWLAKI